MTVPFYITIGYRVEMLDIKSGQWIEITFVEGYEPKCSLGNIPQFRKRKLDESRRH